MIEQLNALDNLILISIMAIWLVRAGKSGEYEKKFLDEGRVYFTWDINTEDLTGVKEYSAVYKIMENSYPGRKKRQIGNYAGQLYAFLNMKIGDWIVMPSKFKSTMHIGEVSSGYKYNPQTIAEYIHYVEVKWIKKDIPRTNFDQDILYSLGAFLTVCGITRNDAEKRIRAMEKNNWMMQPQKTGVTVLQGEISSDPNTEAQVDLEIIAADQITRFIDRKFKGHGMSRIIEAILKAKGYIVYRSPAGPDKGVDLLAAPEPLGFGSPRLCVQVKTTSSPVDRPTLDQLIGTMQNFNADQGLLVSWSGFKTSVDKEIPSQFFKVRLWGQEEIINELLSNYEKLDDDIKTEIPMKRIWTLLPPDEA